MNVIPLPQRNELDEKDSGLLFSILYLWLELKKQGFGQTTDILRDAVDTFFEEMRTKGKLSDDYEAIRSLLEKILLLNAQEIEDYINYAASTGLEAYE